MSPLRRGTASLHPFALWLPGGVLVAMGITLMLSVAPSFRSVPGRDSGVFLYMASLVLEGKLPYRDVWDHKPPAIYYLDALGLALGGRTLWGVWAIQTLFVCAAILLGFALMRKALGVAPALFGSVAWLGTLGLLLIWDNYPEEYALPLQFGSLYLFYEIGQLERPQHRAWPGTIKKVFIGVSAATCFLLKPTLVGTQLTIVAVLTFRRMSPGSRARRNDILGDLGAICAGILLVLIPVTAYFYANGALEQAFDAVFSYGIVYSAAPSGDRLLSILSGLGGLPALSGTPALALISWIGICRQALSSYRHEKVVGRGSLADGCNGSKGSNSTSSNPAYRLLALLMLIDLPIELLLVAIPGRSYGYYYTACLPAFGILCAVFARTLMEAVNARAPWIRAGCLCLFLPVLVGVPVLIVSNRIVMPTSTAATRAQAARYIADHTSVGDQVLLWGDEPGLNFAAGRRSPSRFAYQYPLYTSGYGDESLVMEFLSDIKNSRPALIIDASASDRITPPIDVTAREQWAPMLVYDMPPQMSEVFHYINSHYQFVGSLGPDGWRVYMRKGYECAHECSKPSMDQVDVFSDGSNLHVKGPSGSRVSMVISSLLRKIEWPFPVFGSKR